MNDVNLTPDTLKTSVIRGLWRVWILPALVTFFHNSPSKHIQYTHCQSSWLSQDILFFGGRVVYDALSRARPDVVINAAAFTDVDGCELQRDKALAINALGPRHLALVCLALGIRLLHVSTDYVFSGTAADPGPYTEDAPVHPVNWYGETKRRGEQAVAEICATRIPWLIVRTALLYGHYGDGRTSFVTWLIKELHANRSVKIVNDQFNTPTFADDLAAGLIYLAQQESNGIIHLAGPDLIRRDLWAREIAAYHHLDMSLIEITTTGELGQIAPRPLYSGLCTHRAGDVSGVTMRGVHAGLTAFQADGITSSH